MLLNPAVHPARDLSGYVGELEVLAQRRPFRVPRRGRRRPGELEPAALTAPERYFAVIAKGDEVLDWREMTARVAGCRVKLLERGDHALSDFDDHLPDVLAFLGLGPMPCG